MKILKIVMSVVVCLAGLAGVAMADLGDIRQSGVPLADGSSIYGFSFIADGGVVVWVSDDRNVAGRDALLPLNAVVVEGVDIYDPAEVSAWVNANYEGQFQAALTGGCSLNRAELDPDGGLGSCFRDDGLSGSVGLNRNKPLGW